MSDFKVSIVNGQVNVLCGDYLPETDIIDLLEFNELKLEDLYQDHAAIQARWEQIAINLKNQYDRFDEEFAKKWWAHNKRFAKLSLLGQGEKNPTVDSIRDTTILFTSRDITDNEREKYIFWAHKASKSKSPDKDIEESIQDFSKQMSKYLLMDPVWYYEVLISTLKTMEANYLTLQNICKRLESRSFHMKELKDLTMAKHGNTGPLTYKQKIDQEFHTQAITAKSKL